MFCKEGLISLVSVALIALSLASPAAAESCSARLPECISSNRPANGGAPGDAIVKRCKQAVAECKTRCKAGNKVYIGTMTGRQYPVTSCD
ncbi:hypothetical protein JQ543_15060 [Bradyrhizobium diazoefficiens]|nr:hypothetical protein [Bradyrhizobium diazoefficiens]MBR0774668.1 hypothetical protein [Bradyrhizobium diazoefficiens]MBR0849070.1 hypothetical protein [Bradyrhizobium diazoefficiens]